MELHQQGADILLQDGAGCTLLHHAVQVGSKEVVQYLIDHGETLMHIGAEYMYSDMYSVGTKS